MSLAITQYNQSYSPSKAKMIAMATSLSCRLSAVSTFCRPSTQTPLHNQSPSRYRPHKASYGQLRPKIGCHGNVPQHLWTPSNTRLLRPIRAHNPNGIWIDSAVCAQMTVESSYFTMGRPFPLKIASSHGDLNRAYPIHGSLGPPEASVQTAYRSVQPFLQGSLV